VTQRLGLAGGVLAFLVLGLAPTPEGLPAEAQWTAATAVLMAIWWLTEALHPAATALLPVVILPLVGAMRADDITRPYASETNFLFLGGLMIATAVERWNLHRRLALWIIDSSGRTPSGLLFGFMAATASISAWISNAATTMMMIPIAMAVLGHFRRESPEVEADLARPLLLSIAYSASIGGLATIVGTPPNAIFVGSMARLFPDAPPVGFLQWMMVGVPVVVVLLPICWLYLVRVASTLHTRRSLLDRGAIGAQRAALGAMSTPERRVLLVFCATAFLWMFRTPIDAGAFFVPGWSQLLPDARLAGDSTVAIAMALVLFLTPSGSPEGGRLLDWTTASRIPWGVLILLGGGFALAEATRASGLALWIGGWFDGLGAAPAVVKVLGVCVLITFLTEVMTNTSVTTIMMPVLAAAAVASGTDPLLLMIPCTLSASIALMMPSGTAPNAIVFSTGHLSIAYMARVGIVLNLVSIVVVAGVVMLLAEPVFGVRMDSVPVWGQ
jgi:sodium-dependent dicarboxylate transporter 2/3/5